MVGHSLIEDAKVILEPSCGDGVFLDALRQCRTLNEGMRIDAVELSEQALLMVACIDLLADNGLPSFVIPAEILQVAYAEDLRRFLAREYEYVTLVTFRKLIFEDIEQETVIFIGKKGPKPDMIRVAKVEDISEMRLRNFEDVEYQPLDLESGKWTRCFVDAHDAKTLSIFQEDGVSEAYGLDDKTLPLIGRSSHASGGIFHRKGLESQ